MEPDPAYFIDVLSRFLTGTDEYRLHFIFDLFDRDKDGFLQRMDFIKLLRTLIQINEELNDDRRLAAQVSSTMKFRNVAGRSNKWAKPEYRLGQLCDYYRFYTQRCVARCK